MARPKDKKNLSGDIPAELHEELISWIDKHNNVKLRQCLQAMAELWLLLPERMQAILLLEKRDSENFKSIADEISKAFKAWLISRK